jgi:hypothetical protein
MYASLVETPPSHDSPQPGPKDKLTQVIEDDEVQSPKLGSVRPQLSRPWGPCHWGNYARP